MTQFLQHYTLKYTPLSPVHIGTGESYEPTNYVIDNDTLYEFDTGGAVMAFGEADRKELMKIVNGRGSEQMLKAVQTFFYDRRNSLKPWAVNAIPVLDGVANLYNKRIGRAANTETGGKEVLNKLEIDRTAYNPINRKPALFGSSIKGAIRTALLNKENNGRRAYEKKGLHEFQGRIFKYIEPERKKRLFELDPMRLINIADASWRETDYPTTHVYLAVNRKKDPVIDEQKQLRAAMGENLYQILECVPGCYYQAFQGQLSLHDVGNNKHPSLPATEFRYDIADIAKACNDFYGPLLAQEIKLIQQREYINTAWKTALTGIYKLSEEKRKANQAFLLRIGRHSGAEAVTVNGARNGNIKIMRGKGQPPEFADTPKTLWLAANDPKQRINLLPFGWVLVEILRDGEADTAWPELEAICASQHQKAKQWAEANAKEQAQFAAKRQADAQRREQEQQARQQREEQARIEERIRQEQAAQAERDRQEAEKKLLEMSPLDRDIDQLLKANKDPNKKPYLILLEAVKANRWQDADKVQVLKTIQAKMQEAGDWRPTTQKKDPSKDKEHQRTLEVQKLIAT